jgi:anthranilate/para-aminobenzoate synthase component I
MGWLRGAGDCRFSLALRGLYRCGSRSFLQAGAGILAESVPEAELLETTYKLSAMKDALASAVLPTRTPEGGNMKPYSLGITKSSKRGIK